MIDKFTEFVAGVVKGLDPKDIPTDIRELLGPKLEDGIKNARDNNNINNNRTKLDDDE